MDRDTDPDVRLLEGSGGPGQARDTPPAAMRGIGRRVRLPLLRRGLGSNRTTGVPRVLLARTGGRGAVPRDRGRAHAATLRRQPRRHARAGTGSDLPQGRMV